MMNEDKILKEIRTTLKSYINNNGINPEILSLVKELYVLSFPKSHYCYSKVGDFLWFTVEEQEGELFEIEHYHDYYDGFIHTKRKIRVCPYCGFKIEDRNYEPLPK